MLQATKSDYMNFKDINRLQEDIMKYVHTWARTEKTPIPQTEITKKMELDGEKYYTILNALKILLRKGYIRRAYASSTNKTFYVQLKSV